MTNTPERELFFNPISGELRFDLEYDCPDHIPENISWPMDQQRQNKKYGFKNLTLTLTMKCNLNCDYCWQHHNNSQDISKETIDQWLDFFLDPINNSPHKILYYGGEPLLRMDLIEYSSKLMKALCKERGISPIKQHIFTNATLLSDANLDVIQHEDIFLILSIDGAPHVNAFHRYAVPGDFTNELITQGINRLHQRGIKFGVCCTLSDVDFDSSNTVGYILEELRPNSIELNLRHDAAFCSIAEKHAGQHLDSFYAAWDLIRKHDVINIDLRKRTLAIASRVPLQNCSSGSKNKLSVMPNGMISSFNGAVSYPELQIAPVGDWITSFKSRWARNVLTAKKCERCRAAYICGQGSAFSSYLQHGDFQCTPALHCEYCNTMLDYIIQTIRNFLLSQENIPYGYVVTPADIYNAFQGLFAKI